jgi:hypothetical protein
MVFNIKKICVVLWIITVLFIFLTFYAINKALYAFTIFPDLDKVVKERLSFDFLPPRHFQ